MDYSRVLLRTEWGSAAIVRSGKSRRRMSAKGHSLPNWAARDMSVHHPIADNTADIAS
jgi:hypothetical protein